MFLYCSVEFRAVFLYLFLGVDCLTRVSVCLLLLCLRVFACSLLFWCCVLPLVFSSCLL